MKTLSRLGDKRLLMKTADCGGKRLGEEYGDDVSFERSLEAGCSSGMENQEQRDETAKTRRREDIAVRF